MRKEELKTPCYVVQEKRLKENLEILKDVKERSGCRILLAQKAFSMYSSYPLIKEYLDGTTASGLFEARLGAEYMGGENHIFSPAYREDEMDQILKLCDHLVFNSFSQLEKYKDKLISAKKSVGLRINPECSTQEGHAIYDPCAPGSRLGILRKEFPEKLPDFVEGLHFHTLCEQNFDALAVTLKAVEEKFGSFLSGLKWLNLGGGHHITREDYDREGLIACIRRLKETYGLEVYLEPGEAVALDAGELITTVEDLVHEDSIAIVDVSAACHMPDVLEMPYRPPLMGAGEENEKPFTYLLAGPTCLAGDRIGSYSFDRPLRAGDRLIFQDMAIYTMVKNNTFNGMRLPDIVWEREDGDCQVVRTFGYEDFKGRL